MALSWLLPTTGLLLMLVLLAWVAYRRRKRTRWPAWEVALQAGDAAHTPYRQIETDLEDELGGLLDTLGLARVRRARGDIDEAVRVLRIAAQHVARYVPSLLDRLSIWWEVARAMAALYPLPSLTVWRFEGWRLRGLAAGEVVLRPWLGAVRAFGLRIRVLAYGCTLVLGGFRNTLRALDTERTDVDDALQRMSALSADLGALQAASLDVYKALLISLYRRTTPPPD